MAATPSHPKPTNAPLVKRAKLFMNGRSQAVRLPKEFRFEGTEVEVRRDPATGDLTLTQSAPQATSKKSPLEQLQHLHSLKLTDADLQLEIKKIGQLTAQELFEILDWAEFPDDFMADRQVHMPRELDLF